ncbi:hypothetical protein [Helicobacter zhangjianzhongii]|uniref:Uncharacterized protein n=1 Tax=Helicobacter zhangjianzhongii TaxID=2974574 RepID=A0ACC6FRC6_9HELI|nr:MULTISPECIES: hypothetical protein [unclassified Helicobacter]MDL0080042.1 hypothetical protein [Helicobacter sp. CPD2-1]MDL0081831.1 hypothetical protein [Helicobacter sp. XJK30-2]
MDTKEAALCHADFIGSRVRENGLFRKACFTSKSLVCFTKPALLPHDSKSCGGAAVALRLMVKVSELGVRAFAISRNTAALLTQG